MVAASFISMLFVPLVAGDPHVGTVRLWGAYQLLAMPSFYNFGSNDSLEYLAFGAVFVHHLLSWVIPLLVVRMMRGRIGPT